MNKIIVIKTEIWNYLSYFLDRFYKKENFSYIILLKMILKVFLIITVFTPLIVDSSVFYQFTTAKSLYIRGILFVESILFIYLSIASKEFRDEIFIKLNRFINNSVFITVVSFIVIYIISTIFAVDKYIAFWGDLQRAEGLVGILFYFSFFIFFLLVFNKKDWIWFFKMSLFVGLVILLKEFLQFFNGAVRPGSFAHNPAFLSGYLLFPILSSFIILNGVKNNFWKYFSIIMLFLSILGIFITETRGTILGVLLGFIVTLIYLFFEKKSKNIFVFKRINIHKLSLIILVFIFIFSIIFISTIKNQIWQNVPGFSRIAIMNSEDSTINTRLIIGRSGIQSINPIENGIKKFLIGWGSDNFYLASGKYFNSKQFDYEITWFDKSHNKFIDVLVANGILGLIAYLFIFILYFKFIFKKSKYCCSNDKSDISIFSAGLIFFGISYFVHLLFLFDQISTSILFFTILSFCVYFDSNSYGQKEEKINFNILKYITLGFFVLFIFLSFIFIRNDLIGYIQMRRYFSLIRNNKSTITITLNEINKTFYPITVAQFNIRSDFISFLETNKIDGQLSKIAYHNLEQYLQKDPLNVQLLFLLADSYTNNGKDLGDIEYLSLGEKHFKEIISFAPNRFDILYKLSINLFFQKKYEESYLYFNKSANLSPKYFEKYNKENNNIYLNFFQNSKH